MSPSRAARVDRPARSDPEPGSENNWHPCVRLQAMPLSICCCRGVPNISKHRATSTRPTKSKPRGNPVEETRVVIFEMWADAASLAAHFEHPNFFQMQKLMAQMGIKSGEVAKYRCDLKGAIYDSTPRARADFFDAADVAG